MKDNTVMINWGKVRWTIGKQQLHRPDNVGAVITFTLIFQHLHDTYGWGRYKFAEIMHEFEEFMHPPYPDYRHDYAVLADVGMDTQMFHDYLRRTPKMQEKDDTYRIVLGRPVFCGKVERGRYIESAEVTYLLNLRILHEKFKFKAKKIRRLQQHLKLYQRCIIDGDVRIVEFMQYLSMKCGQRYGALETYIQNTGKAVDIFGEGRA